MARESRSASSSAASALGNGHMRQPPAAGPAGRGMHGDDAFEAGFFVEEGVDAFVALEGGGIEQGHAADITGSGGRNCACLYAGPVAEQPRSGAGRRLHLTLRRMVACRRARWGSAARRTAAARRDRG